MNPSSDEVIILSEAMIEFVTGVWISLITLMIMYMLMSQILIKQSAPDDTNILSSLVKQISLMADPLWAFNVLIGHGLAWSLFKSPIYLSKECL